MYRDDAGFETLKGKTITKFDVNREKDHIDIETACGRKFAMYHSQDCCETVVVDDLGGDVENILNTPVVGAEARTSDVAPNGCDKSDESNTWTFYSLTTWHGWLTIRWHGSSNGYYSESVTFAEVS